MTLSTISGTADADGQLFAEKITPLQPAKNIDQRKIRLGGRMFADPIMSSRSGLSCGSCHDLATSGTVNIKRTVGYEGRTHRFNTPTIFNVANNYRFGWRGNFTELTEQNEQVLLDRNLMANDWPALLTRLTNDPGYREDFLEVYDAEPNRGNVLDALVAFQESLVTPDAPFDLYLKGSPSAISTSQKQGFQLFQDYGCISCHQGSNLGGNLSQKFGIFAMSPGGTDSGDGDVGRLTAPRHDGDRGYFRVPGLRNVAVTGPYFHDGRAKTLEEAVKVMANVQTGQDIRDDDIRAIVDFLNTLTGEYNGIPLQSGPPAPANLLPSQD